MLRPPRAALPWACAAGAMPPKAKKEDNTAAAEDRLTRIAIVSTDRCRPKKCRHECKKSCPVVKIGAPRACVASSVPRPCALTPGAQASCVLR